MEGLDRARAGIAHELGIDISEISSVEAGDIFFDLAETVPKEVWGVGLQTSPDVRFWKIRSHFYLDDPLFAEGLIDFNDLDYNDRIGLHIKPGKSQLTRAKLPDTAPKSEKPDSQADAEKPSPEPFVEVTASGDMNELFISFNHYISTGDRIGQGMAMDVKDQLLCVIIHNPRELEDKDNWERLNARLGQIAIEEGVPIAMQKFPPDPKGMHGIGVLFPKTDTKRMIQLLRAKPGPLGWGSIRSFLIRHGVVK